MFSNRLAKMVGVATDEELHEMYKKASPLQQEAYDRRMNVLLKIKIVVLVLILIGMIVLRHFLD